MINGFNTQPPEGGCGCLWVDFTQFNRFNTQPPEGGCTATEVEKRKIVWFQHTAARRRLRITKMMEIISFIQFQHTAARRRLHKWWSSPGRYPKFQHTAARRRLPVVINITIWIKRFQHTAARRRLLCLESSPGITPGVSTHSRPKAAAPYIKKQEKSAY